MIPTDKDGRHGLTLTLWNAGGNDLGKVVLDAQHQFQKKATVDWLGWFTVACTPYCKAAC